MKNYKCTTKIILKSMILVGFVVLVIFIAGCANLRPVVLHPIEQIHFFYIEKGTQIGDIVTEEPGYFLSEFYLEEVGRARVGK